MREGERKEVGDLRKQELKILSQHGNKNVIKWKAGLPEINIGGGEMDKKMSKTQKKNEK